MPSAGAEPLRHEHERECVKRPGPLDHFRVLEAERARFFDKLVAYDDVIAAGAAEPCGVPCVEDFALRQPQKTLPGFRHAVAIDPRDAVFLDDAAQPDPFTVLAPADERKAPADAVAPGTGIAFPVVVAAAPVATRGSGYISRATS